MTPRSFIACAAACLVLAAGCSSEGEAEETVSEPGPRLTTTTAPEGADGGAAGPAAPSAVGGRSGTPVQGPVAAPSGEPVPGCPGGWPAAHARSMEWHPSEDIEGRFEVRVEGDVQNTTDHAVQIHSVELIIRSQAGEEMTVVTAFPTDAQGRGHQPVLDPGAITQFVWGDYVYWDESRPGEHPDTVQIFDLSWRWADPYASCPAG